MERLVPLLVLAALVAVPVFFIWGKRAFDLGAEASLETIYK
jgi:hypothetical protein